MKYSRLPVTGCQLSKQTGNWQPVKAGYSKNTFFDKLTQYATQHKNTPSLSL